MIKDGEYEKLNNLEFVIENSRRSSSDVYRTSKRTKITVSTNVWSVIVKPATAGALNGEVIQILLIEILLNILALKNQDSYSHSKGVSYNALYRMDAFWKKMICN